MRSGARPDLSQMTKTIVSPNPIPLISLPYKAPPSLISIPKNRLFSALPRRSPNQLCYHIAWCTVAAGDKAICQERSILKMDTSSDTHICAEEIRARGESHPQYFSFHKDAVLPGSPGDSRGFEVGLGSVVCRHHTPGC